MMDIKRIYELYRKHPMICTDTRKIIPGSIFFSLRGENFNGNRFVQQALDEGAAYAMVDADMAVVEMGANHQREIDELCRIAEPDFGLITNVGKAHLEGFGGFEGVMKGKSELYRYLASEKKIIFINSDNEFLKHMAKSAGI